jgi:hypothetical protein
LLTPCQASALDIPLFPRIAAIEFSEGTGSASNSQCGGVGYDSPLTGPQATLFFQFVAAPCSTTAPTPPPTEAECIAINKELTQCIDVCFKHATTGIFCPGDAWCDSTNPNPPPAGKAFVYYSKDRGIGADLKGILGKDEQLYMPNSASFKLPISMAEASDFSQIALFIRVNRQTRDDALDENTNLPESGAAYIPQRLSTSPDGKFELWGNLGVPPVGPAIAPVDDLRPFALDDVCTEGTKVGFGPALMGRDVCTSTAQASLYANLFDKFDQHQFEIIQRQILPGLRHLAWTNGGGENCQPTRIMLASHVNAFGQAGAGRFYMNPENYVALDPVTDPFVGSGSPSDMHRLGAHEYFHMLQGRWSQESPAAASHIGMLLEEHAESVTYNSCLSLDNSNPSACISGVKLGPTSGLGLKMLGAYEVAPSLNAVFTPYAGGAFQVYANEQFSYTTLPGDPNSPHPGGIGSFRNRPGVLSPSATKTRNSDEGGDLMGLLFSTFDQAQPGDGTVKLMDQCFQNNLGRSFPGLVADFHTALFLKDYDAAVIAGDTSSAARWRFEWDGDGDSLVPSDTFKPYFPPGVDASVPFGHRHATRVLDSYNCTVSGCPAPSSGSRLILPSGGVLSGVFAATSAYGAAAWSVKPAPGWVGSSVPFMASGYGAVPRFRAFAIQQSISSTGKNMLSPRPICGSAPDYFCTTSAADGAGSWNLSTAIPVDASTDEILVIASALGQPTQTNWSFGNGTPSVNLTAPTASQINFIGHPSAGIFPVYASAIYLGPEQLGLPIQPSTKIELEVPGCANASGPGGCKLSGGDITVIPLSNGTFMVLSYLPASFYPSASALAATGGQADLDLRVLVDGIPSNTQATSLRTSVNPDVRATSLVIDNSGSMGGAKLAGAKVAAKAIVNSLVPASGAPQSRWLNIVTFSDDASTIPLSTDAKDYGFTLVSEATKVQAEQAIDAISPLNFTSIGDGMFEAQSNMACKFQPGLANAPPAIDSFHMHVLSDGLNNRPAAPVQYYQGGDAPTKDGNGDWCSTTLTWYGRNNQALQVPSVSTIAFGQDADGATLQDVSRVTGGLYSYAPDGLSTTSQAIYFLSEAFLMGQNGSDGTQRIAAATIPGDADQVFIVEPGATELRIVLAAENIPLNQGGLAYLFHISDQGVEQVIPSESRNGGSLVLKVIGPKPGIWRLRLDIPQDELFFEAAVSSQTRFLAFAEPGKITTKSSVAPLIKSTTTSSGEVELRATTFSPTGALPGCNVQAVVVSPLGYFSSHLLLDDGKSSDGAPSDGVFGKTLHLVPMPGTYSAYFASVCVDPSGQPLWRQASRAFYFSFGTDSDGDGMPDAWEITHALNPQDASDASQDLDDDGLDNLGEYEAGTNPQLGDSDGGGESDGSEVAAGRDPLFSSDDQVGSLLSKFLFGNASAAIFLGGNYDVSDIDIDSIVLASTLTPGSLVASQTSVSRVPASRFRPGLVVVPLEPGRPNCLRVRLKKENAYGPWSETHCQTPGSDTTAPRVIVHEKARRHGRWVTVDASVLDDIPHEARGELQSVLGLSSVGPVEIRVGALPDLNAASWQPYAERSFRVRLSRALRQASGLWIQARDGAGNLSDPQPINILSRAEMLVDRAITLEEDALEEVTEKKIKKRIRQSLPRLKRAAQIVRDLPGGQAVRGQVDALVAQIVSLKTGALKQVNQHELVVARATLEQAMSKELELALLLERFDESASLRDLAFSEDGEPE